MDTSSSGRGREDRKLLLEVGVDDEELKSFLYVDAFELVCKGEVCGELYKAKITMPRENISAPNEMLLSSTKSGEV